MTKYLIIALGGAAGSMLRFWAAGQVGERWGIRFPYGTLAINVSASFLIGLIMTLLAERAHFDPFWGYLLVIGFLGGYSTFSSFTYETFRVFEDGEFLIAALNIVFSVGAGLAAVWAGVITGRSLA